MSEQDKIIEKIKKLFALSASPNEHEAGLAMQRAYELMEKYEVSITEIEREQSAFTKAQFRASRTETLEQKYVLQILIDHFYVRIIHMEGLKAFGKNYCIVGKKHNVILAYHVYTFLSETFKRLWRTNGSKLIRKKMKPKRRNKIRESYYFGLHRSLDQKLIDKRNALQAEGIVLASDSADLEEFLKNLLPDMHVKEEKIEARDFAAYEKGMADGSTVEINKPIPSHEQRVSLLE